MQIPDTTTHRTNRKRFFHKSQALSPPSAVINRPSELFRRQPSSRVFLHFPGVFHRCPRVFPAPWFQGLSWGIFTGEKLEGRRLRIVEWLIKLSYGLGEVSTKQLLHSRALLYPICRSVRENFFKYSNVFLTFVHYWVMAWLEGLKTISGLLVLISQVKKWIDIFLINESFNSKYTSAIRITKRKSLAQVH